MDILTLISETWRALWASLSLNPAAIEVVRASAHPITVAVMVGVVAGSIRLLGQSAVLFVNRVSRQRFWLTIGVEVALYVARLAIWAWVTWTCARLIFAAPEDYATGLWPVLLGSAPFLFGMFILVPHLGIYLTQVFRFWSFCVTVVMVQATYHLDLLPAILCAGLGWIAVQILDEVTARLLIFWRDVAWNQFLNPARARRAPQK